MMTQDNVGRKCIWCKKEKLLNEFRKPKDSESILRTQFCHYCYNRLSIKVRNHNKRAAGILTISIWLKILEESKGFCYYCHKYKGVAQLSIEHVIPTIQGGTNELPNIVPACKTCNNSKRDRSVEDWQRSVQAKRLLAQLQEKLGLSKFETMNKAIFTLAEKEGLIHQSGNEAV